jgi:hypothetical protein
MKRKMYVMFICTLVFLLTLPILNISAIKSDDVDISITAGRVGLDFGYGIHVRARKPENVSMTFYVNITHNSLIGNRINKYNWNFTCDEYQWGKIFNIGPKAYFNTVNITVEVDTIVVAREGYSIGRLVILE